MVFPVFLRCLIFFSHKKSKQLKKPAIYAAITIKKTEVSVSVKNISICAGEEFNIINPPVIIIALIIPRIRKNDNDFIFYPKKII
ncbi:hypothetical protein GMMP15_620010 [Candidatus Magnetomoraceae bacterium gMMP-15]